MLITSPLEQILFVLTIKEKRKEIGFLAVSYFLKIATRANTIAITTAISMP
jgi:hypothetical protein